MQGIRLRHVNRYRVKGRIYWYHRLTRERLPDEPNARAKRVLEINATMEGWRDDTIPGSLGDLIARYKASPEFQRRTPATRRGYMIYLDLLGRGFGDLAVEDADRAWLYELRDNMADTPRAANSALQIASILMGWAVDRGWRPDNPVRGVKKLKTTGRYEPWPDVAIERFRHEANPRMMWALELALYTGQRQGDVLAMQWRHIQDGLISVEQAKTGERLVIPIHPDLAAVLDRFPREHMYIVTRQDGRPYTSGGFRTIFRRELARLCLTGLQFHGLRPTAGKRLAEAGCTDREIMAILGHRTASMVTLYTRGAEQKRLAKAAIVKLGTRTKLPNNADRTA